MSFSDQFPWTLGLWRFLTSRPVCVGLLCVVGSIALLAASFHIQAAVYTRRVTAVARVMAGIRLNRTTQADLHRSLPNLQSLPSAGSCAPDVCYYVSVGNLWNGPASNLLEKAGRLGIAFPFYRTLFFLGHRFARFVRPQSNSLMRFSFSCRVCSARRAADSRARYFPRPTKTWSKSLLPQGGGLTGRTPCPDRILAARVKHFPKLDIRLAEVTQANDTIRLWSPHDSEPYRTARLQEIKILRGKKEDASATVEEPMWIQRGPTREFANPAAGLLKPGAQLLIFSGREVRLESACTMVSATPYALQILQSAPVANDR